nr:TonB-dependent receptor plug domain-containing protein [uncultured Campylobacter sp.]
MKKFHLALSLCAVLCLSAQADEKSSATDVSKSKDSNRQSLGVIEVTSDSSTPSTVDDVKINTRNATLVKDVFRDIPGVYVGGTNGMNQKIYMRGVSDRGLNITIDGAKQNGNTFHHNADLLIDPDLIKAVEVDVGARSVVNDSGALGGSVAFKTVDASDLLEEGQDIGAKLKVGYTSNNEGYSQSAMLYGRVFDSLDMLAAFKHYGYGFGESGNGKPTGGDGNDINYLLKAGYSFLDFHKFLFQPSICNTKDYILCAQNSAHGSTDSWINANTSAIPIRSNIRIIRAIY